MRKKLILACLRKGGRSELREFGTITGEIKELAGWLHEAGCEMVAIESTGVYWKPLYSLFELLDINAIVVNAAHMKSVPGRKTDMKDAEWIAELLRHGLLKASFIPGRKKCELLDLTRCRKSLIEERSRELNRLQKVLETANIKLDSILTGINGKNFRRLLEKIAASEVPKNAKAARRNKGNKTLKSMLKQCAISAKRVKASSFSAKSNCISARRGKNRAAVSVAHSSLTVIFHILKERVPYCDLGSDYYDSIHREYKINGYLKRLQALGWSSKIPVTA